MLSYQTENLLLGKAGGGGGSWPLADCTSADSERSAITRGTERLFPLSLARPAPAPAATPMSPAAAPSADAEGALPDTIMEFFSFCCCCRKCSILADTVLLLRSREWKEFHRRIGSIGPGLLPHIPPALHVAVAGTVPLLKPPISDLYCRCCISSCVECLCIVYFNFIFDL
jgi:hypothetical protein